jgi:hypothetical protein
VKSIHTRQRLRSALEFPGAKLCGVVPMAMEKTVNSGRSHLTLYVLMQISASMSSTFKLLDKEWLFAVLCGITLYLDATVICPLKTTPNAAMLSVPALSRDGV